jgi:hypothetical protein
LLDGSPIWGALAFGLTCFKTGRRWRTVEKVVTRVRFGQDDGDAAYWQAQSPEARLAALEEIRREYHLWKYGSEPPFRKVVTIVKTNGEVVRRWG